MAPSVRDLLYEETLSRLKLPILEERREDQIAVYRVVKGLQNVNRNDLFVWDSRDTIGYEKNVEKHLLEISYI